MINSILILYGIALVIVIFVMIPEVLRRKRETQKQKSSHMIEARMDSMRIEIPSDVISAIKLPRKELDKTLKAELAIHLYATGILSFGPARRLAEMSKMEFHFLLGQRHIERQYDEEDYKKDLANLAKWETR